MKDSSLRVIPLAGTNVFCNLKALLNHATVETPFVIVLPESVPAQLLMLGQDSNEVFKTLFVVLQDKSCLHCLVETAIDRCKRERNLMYDRTGSLCIVTRPPHNSRARD